MPIELIPNQPFIFEQALPDQPCLNNDDNAYSQLITSGDTICVQQIITPCTEDVLCDPGMYLEGSELMTGSWAVFGGWSSADLNHIAYDGASHTPADYTSLNVAIVQGRVYRLTFEVTSITGEGSFYANLGIGLPENGVLYDALGTYTSYFIGGSTGSLALYFQLAKTTPVAGDTVEITVTSLKQWADDCWDSEILITPLEYPFTYSFDETTLQGKFCANASDRGGDLINYSAYSSDGNYHRVSFTITDMSAGGIEVVLGGTYLGTATENGVYQFYGVPTSGNDLIFRKSPTFDGCISYVDVEDFGYFNTEDAGDSLCQLTVVNEAHTQESSIIDFEVWDDRIIWCFNTSILSGETSPIEMTCEENYQLKIFYSCSGGTTYYSTTRFRIGTWDCSFIVSAYSDGYAFGFYFGSVTAPLFYLTQRLRVLQFAPKYPAIGEEYLYSNGSFSRSFAQSGKIRQAWFDYVDEPTHDVIRLQLLSDVLTLDSDVYFAPLKDYEPEWDEHRYNLSQSRVDLVKEETLFNRSCSFVAESPCTTNVVTIPPSTTISYKMTGVFNLLDVDPANFLMSYYINGYYGTNSGNDATTLSGRNAILAYMATFITSGSYGVSGTIINSNIIYVAPYLDITVNATGNYNSTYSACAFAVDEGAHNGNVIVIQPQ